MRRGVQEVSEPFAGLEVRDPLRRHLNKATHLGVPPSPSTVLAHSEAPEPADLDLVPPHQGARDALEDRLDDCGAFLLGQAGDLRQLVDQLRLRHQSDPLRLSQADSRRFLPELLPLVEAGRVDPLTLPTTVVPWNEAPHAWLEPVTKLVLAR